MVVAELTFPQRSLGECPSILHPTLEHSSAFIIGIKEERLEALVLVVVSVRMLHLLIEIVDNRLDLDP
jgi:hypothetical protein